MTERDDPWPPGTPCWVDLRVRDLARSQAFYGAVLGWTFGDPLPENRGYYTALVGGRRVAGLSQSGPEVPEVPRAWRVHLAVADVVATDAAARAAGAHQLSPPAPIGQLGWMAVWLDPTGAIIGAWQAGEHTGYQVTDVPGAVSWNDLMATEDARAKEFYAEVFGYRYQETGLDGQGYAMFSVPGGDRPAGGIGVQDDGLPSIWSVVFAVDDVDAAAERVRANGGVVLGEPWDFEYGRLVSAAGPDGEAFLLHQPNRE